MHVQMQPINERCFCNTAEGWRPKAGTLADCECTNEFLTEDGKCTTCGTMFRGCAEC